MSERAGSVRDARFLSGADIGRTITIRENSGTLFHDGQTGPMTGTITSVEHLGPEDSPEPFVLVSIRGPRGKAGIALDFTDAVTITGADR